MTKDLINRISFYLASGGLFNPELADHIAVRTLLFECREALAQPEQLISDQINYGMSVTQGGKRIDPMSIYKEPEQKPVAWLRTSGTGSPVVTEELLIDKPELRFEFGTPLYTTPPQRKPLTDEEERKAFEQWYVCNAFDYERNPIGSRECGLQWSAWKARAAHGIKGEA